MGVYVDDEISNSNFDTKATGKAFELTSQAFFGVKFDVTTVARSYDIGLQAYARVVQAFQLFYNLKESVG